MSDRDNSDQAAPLIELLEAGNTLAEIVGGTIFLDSGEQARVLERWQRAIVRLAVIHQTREGQ